MLDRVGEFHDGDIVEVSSGDVFKHCAFFECELVGAGGEFLECSFEGVAVPYGSSFIQCVFTPANRGETNA